MINLSNKFIMPFGTESVGVEIVKSHIICGMNEMVKVLLNDNINNINEIAKYYVNDVVISNKISERQFGAAYMYIVFKLARLYADEHLNDMTFLDQIDEEAIKTAARIL